MLTAIGSVAAALFAYWACVTKNYAILSGEWVLDRVGPSPIILGLTAALLIAPPLWVIAYATRYMNARHPFASGCGAITQAIVASIEVVKLMMAKTFHSPSSMSCSRSVVCSYLALVAKVFIGV